MTLSSSAVHQMSVSANVAISRALANGSPLMKSSPRTEPGLVAAVHLGAIPDIAAAWSPLFTLAGLNLKLTGVFCHQSPMAIYCDVRGKRQRSELADFLVVIDLRTSRWTGRRAVLIQAKMAAQAGTANVKKGSGWTQLSLYQNWPRFDFEQAAYRLKSVDLTLGVDSDHSGSYGIIDRHWHRSHAPRWTQLPANPTPKKTIGYAELGDFLARMVAGQSGYGRDVDTCVNPTWTEVVDALMRETFSKTFSHSSTLGNIAAPRSVSAMALLAAPAAGFVVSGGTGGPPDGQFSGIEDGPTGITTLLIEVAAGEIPDRPDWL
ncbi:hypothetical protein [Rhizobium leguminosarum]|uniref:Uncharacterized protein n=1 Tax=Rhizobium leguminosarum TaxID=384 RepID=A0A1B1CEZ5_RHILE|nr:hypothetical protein [Rhizobium leguminosarum]ANP88256.1 hypothetical protein BA011_22640 [Rhizobium leguminosarum]